MQTVGNRTSNYQSDSTVYGNCYVLHIVVETCLGKCAISDASKYADIE